MKKSWGFPLSLFVPKKQQLNYFIFFSLQDTIFFSPIWTMTTTTHKKKSWRSNGFFLIQEVHYFIVYLLFPPVILHGWKAQRHKATSEKAAVSHSELRSPLHRCNLAMVWQLELTKKIDPSWQRMNNHDLRFSSNGFSCHNKLDTHGKKLQLKIRRNYEKQLEPKWVVMAFPGKSEATLFLQRKPYPPLLLCPATVN